MKSFLQYMVVVFLFGGFACLISFLFLPNPLLLIGGVLGLPLAISCATVAENIKQGQKQ